MSGLQRPATMLVAAALWVAPALLAAAPTAALGGYDVGELLRLAGERFDLKTADAVVLLDSESIDLTADGERRTATHRIVWIASELAVGDYADVRVPHRAEEGALSVIALRTWRDGRWWPHESALASTAVVQTLPGALAAADDYSDMRETMLLHDGVELPCVLETAYTVVERGDWAEGDDGVHVFASADPAVLLRFTLAVPEGRRPAFVSRNGAPEPDLVSDGALDRYTWEMNVVDRLPRPLIADAPAIAPAVVWSTWPSWDSLAARVEACFAGAGPLSSALQDSISEATKDAPTPAAKAREIARFVNGATRYVDYDRLAWRFAPRPAERTWETAYGTRLDRAVLAAALFKAAGLDVRPCYGGSGYGAVDAAVPGLARFGGISILVRGDGLEALYDPAAGTLEDGLAPLVGRSLWIAETGRVPEVVAQGPGAASRLRVMLMLGPADDDEGGWTGTGFYDAAGAFSPHHEVMGLAAEASAFLGGVASSVLEGTEVVDQSLERLDRERVTAGFTLTLAAGKPDDRGRTAVVLGEPAGGLLAALPRDVHLYETERASPVLLSGPMEQEVELRLDPGDHETVLLPVQRSVENEVGRFALVVLHDHSRVVVRRTLAVTTAIISPSDWPKLRALLLEETAPRSTTIYLK
jgi:hypothetical protein